MRAVLPAFFLLLAACGSDEPAAPEPIPPPLAAECAPGRPAIERTGTVSQDDAKTYRIESFEVGEGTGRVELSYRWSELGPVPPFGETTLDLGLWDQRGYRTQAGFRGWGGSRQGRIDQGDPPVFVQADDADRGFSPGTVNPGTWHAELGIAAVSQPGAEWLVKIECKAAVAAIPAPVDAVDAAHVANPAAGWYHGDFHMHAYHSHPNGPQWDAFIALAQEARLDFAMVTEYVTGRHWETLGSVQAAHPAFLLWPGREVITYFGHVNTHGETFGLYEYRHGFEDVDIGFIQREAKARGALFQVNHPTIFPPPAFTNFCRGCFFELGDEIDWSLVDTIEILTGPVRATAQDVGGNFPGQIENPFLQTAIDLWEGHLKQGHKLTAVSGSDSKGQERGTEFVRKGYGSSATAVYASELSRAALTAGIEAGHVYVRTRGVERSPALEFTAVAGAQRAMFGDTLKVGPAEAVTLRTIVTGGAGQALRYLRNGETFLEVPVPTDPFEHELMVTRTPDEGPLGTFWRIEALDAETRTAIGNPIFLSGA